MSLPNLRGRVAWVFDEDDYDIDLIIGVRNIKITDVKELAALAMSFSSVTVSVRASASPCSSATSSTRATRTCIDASPAS